MSRDIKDIKKIEGEIDSKSSDLEYKQKQLEIKLHKNKKIIIGDAETKIRKIIQDLDKSLQGRNVENKKYDYLIEKCKIYKIEPERAWSYIYNKIKPSDLTIWRKMTRNMYSMARLAHFLRISGNNLSKTIEMSKTQEEIEQKLLEFWKKSKKDKIIDTVKDVMRVENAGIVYKKMFPKKKFDQRHEVQKLYKHIIDKRNNHFNDPKNYEVWPHELEKYKSKKFFRMIFNLILTN